MMHSSLVDYVQYVGRLLRSRATHADHPIVTESVETHFALQAVKRLDGAAKQRARPITPAEVRHAARSVSGSLNFVLSFRVILLTAWCGAFRLGQLLPHAAFPSQMRMSLDDFKLESNRVLISSRRSKTNVFREKTRTIEVQKCDTDPDMCIVKALDDLLRYRASIGAPSTALLSELDSRLSSFDKFVAVLQPMIPAVQATKSQKGHITGHSFRRGFTHAAMAAGYTLQQIMVHGDWSHPDSVLDSYAVGGVLPSITINKPASRGVPASSSTGAGSSTAASCPTPILRLPWPRMFAPNNPYALMAEVGMDMHSVAARSEADAARLKRARDWELEAGPQ